MRFLKVSLVFVLVGVVLVSLQRHSFFSFEENISRVSDFTADIVHDLKKEVVAPPPLRRPPTETVATLTRTGIIRETNKKRRVAGLTELQENMVLDAVAVKKVDDMFARQYFEHISPVGKGAGDLAEDAGYAYIMIGENLALGGFKDDADVVQAWMDSPGHRANILNARYQEIGVVAKKGMFEGAEVWLAVQTFGLPTSACPEPDEALQMRVDAGKQKLVSLEQELAAKHTELEKLKSARDERYNTEVLAYNKLVGEYNALVSETKQLVEAYNQTVHASNACRLKE
jgi:hypothetical protein